MIEVIYLIVVICGIILIGFIAYLMWVLVRQAESAAAEVREVKLTLAAVRSSTDTNFNTVKSTLANVGITTDARLAEISKVGVAIQALANNNTALQFKLNAVLSRRFAELTNDPVDVEAAKVAQDLLVKYEFSMNPTTSDR